MDKRSLIKYNCDSTRARDSDQNEDDSILGSDELSDLRFSSQDNLLDSSQDGDNQCDVKWDYTSPQTMRQLRKMKGKYSADDVKKIIAKFPDLPVKSPESSFSNIRIMLPPKNAAAVTEKSRQLRAKQREMKLLRKRQKSKQVAQDMILFLQQEQQKQEQQAAEKLKTSSESKPVNDYACRLNNKEDNNTGTSEKSKEEEDECWSDDDLFRDNSFLIEATQNPEKYFTAQRQQLSTGQKNSTDKDPHLNTSRVSRTDQSVEVSMSAKPMFSSSKDKSPLSESVIPSSIHDGFSVRNDGFSKFFSKPTHQSSHTRSGQSSSSAQTKSLSSGKILASSMKSPLRKSLSFDASKKSEMNIAPVTKDSKNSLYIHHQNLHNAKSQAKRHMPNQQYNKISNSCDHKQTAEQDLFDSSLSDELLLQATLSQELAIKCGSSQPISSSSIKKEKFPLNGAFNFSHYPSAASSKPVENASKSSQRKEDNGFDNITNLLLSPVRPGKEDFQALSKMSSKSPLLRCSRKDKSTIPSHVDAKHKSSQGLSSSTPVKCLRAQKDDCSAQAQKAPSNVIAPAVSASSHSPIKCSPEEIEVKRQRAIQKRSLRLAQMSHRKS